LKKISHHSEKVFEKVTNVAIKILGSSLTFILAVTTVIIWFSQREAFSMSLHDVIRDVMHAIIFLSLFLIQKSFNRFSAVLHLKVNELVASHEPARNTVINTHEKTEREISELSKEYDELHENQNDKIEP